MKIGIFPRKYPRTRISPATQAIDKTVQALKTTKQNRSATNVSSVRNKWLPAGNKELGPRNFLPEMSELIESAKAFKSMKNSRTQENKGTGNNHYSTQ